MTVQKAILSRVAKVWQGEDSFNFAGTNLSIVDRVREKVVPRLCLNAFTDNPLTSSLLRKDKIHEGEYWLRLRANTSKGNFLSTSSGRIKEKIYGSNLVVHQKTHYAIYFD